MQPPDANFPPALSPRARIAILAALLLAMGGAVAMVYLASGKADDVPNRDGSPSRALFEASFRPRDDAPVIGVSAAGRHRAYLLQALMRPDAHVYNDLLGDAPVTVTFCDLDECVQVFTAPGRERPLDIEVGGADGRRARKLVLRVGATRYWQDTGLPLHNDATSVFPYVKADFVRTSWGQWREAHPDTDVYVGRLPFTPTDPTIKYALPQGGRD